MNKKTLVIIALIMGTPLLVGIVGYSSSDTATEYTSSSSDFFPIGLYGVDNTSDFPEIAAAGFNLVHSYYFEEDYGEPPRTDKHASDYLDAAQRAGLRVLMGIRYEAVQNPTNRNQQDLPTIRARVNALKDHPALWAYMLFDEPESEGYGRNFPVTPANFNNAYNTIKQVDAFHPVLTTSSGDIDGTYPYLGVDIMMLQYLMLPPGSYDYPWDSLENLREAHRSSFETLASKGITFIFTVQAYNLADDSEMWPEIQERNPEVVGRYPTREEMRFIAYSGIILGAKGIAFVAQYEDISRKKNPVQWQAVSSVASELKSISPILIAPDAKKITVTETAGIEFLLKDYKNNLYLIAANPSAKKKTATFTMSQPATAINVLNESRSIMPKDVSFTDRFDGYGVHCYEISTAAGK